MKNSRYALLWAMFWIPLASAQTFWEYSAQGSFSNLQGGVSSISGSLLIDGTVRAGSGLPSIPRNDVHHLFISSFDLDVGDLNFFGEGPSGNSLYIEVVDPIPGSFEFGVTEWFLDGSGDFTFGTGSSMFLNSNGTQTSVDDIFQSPPEVVRMTGVYYCSPGEPACGSTKMDWTRVGQVAPIPEPEIYAMLGVGLSFMTWAARRKRRYNPPDTIGE